MKIIQKTFELASYQFSSPDGTLSTITGVAAIIGGATIAILSKDVADPIAVSAGCALTLWPCGGFLLYSAYKDGEYWNEEKRLSEMLRRPLPERNHHANMLSDLGRQPRKQKTISKQHTCG